MGARDGEGVGGTGQAEQSERLEASVGRLGGPSVAGGHLHCQCPGWSPGTDLEVTTLYSEPFLPPGSNPWNPSISDWKYSGKTKQNPN